MPTYKQPGLLRKALNDAVFQQCNFEYGIVVVNDGCPFEETHEVISCYADTYPEKIFYINKPNSGLSDARNQGIDAALNMFPALEACYFFDSDNGLLPFGLERFFNSLTDADVKVGWVYPDIVKFGIRETCDTSGRYSAIENRFRNICEAGSMVSRRVLDAGVRFDVDRHGYEDWEFWLQGVKAGFIGKHVPHSGFRYRKRQDSMLAQSAKVHANIMDYIHNKHPELFSTDHVLTLEAHEAPRYALYFLDEDKVIFTPSTTTMHMSRAEFTELFLRSQLDMDYGICPPFILTLTQQVWRHILHAGLDTAILWQLEASLASVTIAMAHIELGSYNHISRVVPCSFGSTSDMKKSLDASDITMVMSRVLRNMLGDGDIYSALKSHSSYSPNGVNYHYIIASDTSDSLIEASRDMLMDMCGLVTHISDKERATHTLDHRDSLEDIHRIERGNTLPFATNTWQLPSIFPLSCVSQKRTVLCCIAPEYVHIWRESLSCLAQEIRANNDIPHLLIVGERSLPYIPIEGFTHHHMLNLPLFFQPYNKKTHTYKDVHYICNGNRLYHFSHYKDEEYLRATLLPFSAVYNFHVPAIDATIGSLGKTIKYRYRAAHKDVNDHGNILASEASYNAIIYDNHHTETALSMIGVPKEKRILWSDQYALLPLYKSEKKS
jgi:glycosyltransferase involved in cell wall biosynthesis